MRNSWPPAPPPGPSDPPGHRNARYVMVDADNEMVAAVDDTVEECAG
jgi:hypothetical protein